MTDQKPKPQTYFAQAIADVELAAKGRFAASQSVTVNGTTPVVAPPRISAQLVEWPDDVPDPTGEAIDGPMPDVTTVSGEPRDEERNG